LEKAMSNEREAFEAWAKEEFELRADGLKRMPNGDYKYSAISDTWAAWQAARQSAGANETTLRVLSSHAIRKHEGVTIFGDPAQVLKVMAAMESAGATDQEPVGIIERDEINGWHMNALIDWEKIGLGTKLYAAPIGDNGASGYIQYSDELMPRTPGEKAAFLEGIEEGRMRAVRDAQPAESARVELTGEEIDAVWDSIPWKDLNVASPEHVSILRRRFARALLARASAKGE
jgi:hypothetical protein